MLLIVGCTGNSNGGKTLVNQTNTTSNQSNANLTNFKNFLNDSYCFTPATNLTLALLPIEDNTTKRELSLTFNTLNESLDLVKNINLTECSSQKIVQYEKFLDFLRSQ